MCLRSEPVGPVPEDTARVARAAFPKGNVYISMRDLLGPIYDDQSFAGLFAMRGRPAEAPWRLALISVMQFREGLSDRQAAEAVRGRIDWKYALGLELTDPGFDFSVLSEFRSRLVDGSVEHLLLDALIDACNERGYLKARGRQRTDSTHVLGVLRVLSRLEQVAETLRAALNAVAIEAPDWLREHSSPGWTERYSRRVEGYRLPKGKEARAEYARTVGADGMLLLELVYQADAPGHLKRLSEIEILRRTWIQQYVVIEGVVRLRDPKEMPRASEQLESPYETEARFATKRQMSWVGYKVHLTETCDEQMPHLVTQVETTVATATDVEQLAMIQDGLARKGRSPDEHLVDGGYVRAQNIVSSRREHDTDLVGPVYLDRQWQAKAGNGFDLLHFEVDWEAKIVRCPRGRESVRWCETDTARKPMVHIDFSPADCTPCSSRSSCTRSKSMPRSLTLQTQAEHEALLMARTRQQTPEFVELYARRAGVEGTISQGVRAFGLRQARYRGLGKTHLQHLATAGAINIGRLTDWVRNPTAAATRISHFAALATN